MTDPPSQPLPARFLRTSFHPPESQISLMSRQRLIEPLERSLSVRLFLLIAPAGCGKTTLLSQWHESLKRQRVRRAWLNVVRDSAPPALLQSLGWAFELAGVDIHATGLLGGAGDEAVNVQDSVAVMLSAVSQAQEPVLLILDEFDRLRNPDSLALLELFVAAGPPNLHVILAGRRRPEFSISALLTQGMVATLHAEEMAFSREEARSLLAEVVKADDMELILRKTEGWPVALTLAKLCFRQGRQRSDVLAEFKGDIMEVSSYLAEQVIAGVSEDLREFLLDVCILDQISPTVADRLRNRRDSLASLHALSELQPIMTQLDSREPILRLHPLLADHLIHTLRMTDRGRLVHLLETAAAIYVASGRLVDGIRYALEAENAELACRLLVNEAPIWICVIRGSTEVSTCLGLLPEAQRRKHPRLRLCEIFILVRRGEHSKAEAEFHRLTAERGDPSVEYLLESFTIEVYLGMRSQEVGERKVEELEAAYRACGRIDRGARVVIDALALIVHLRAARLTEAQQKLEVQEAAYLGLPMSGSALHNSVHGCHILLARGRLAEAEVGLRRVLRLARAVTGPDRSVAPIARSFLAQVYYETDRDELNETELGNLLDDLDKSDAWLDHYATVYGVAIEAAYRSGGFPAASRLVSKGRIVARKQLLGESFDHFIMTLEADLLTRDGNLTSAARWLDGLTARAGKPSTYYLQDAVARALARLALRRERPADALKVARQWAAAAGSEGREAAICRAKLIEAIALKRRLDLDKSTYAWTEACAWAATETAIAPFLELQSELLELLSAYDAAGFAPQSTYDDFLGLVRGKLTQGPESRRIVGMLTKREAEIFGLLRRSASNKHIARTASITEDAVKFHLKNIYRKLGVHSRNEALAAPDAQRRE